MSEENLRKCKKCEQLKKRILIGRYGNTLNKKYSDEDGRLWSGSTCPNCHADRAKNNMRKLRELRVKQS